VTKNADSATHYYALVTLLRPHNCNWHICKASWYRLAEVQGSCCSMFLFFWKAGSYGYSFSQIKET